MNLLKGKIKLLMCAVAIISTAFAMDVKADAASPTVLEADVSTPAAGCVFVGMEGTYYADDQKALNRINEIRLEACKAGNVRDPRNKSRFLTEADYVPIKWSTALEKTARMRAAEASMYVSYGGLSHNRMNKRDTFTVSYVDSKTGRTVSSNNEVLAWNWSSDMLKGVEQWYEEKNAWVNQTKGVETGHYTAMINPNNKYVGLGTFCCDSSRYYNTTAGEFSATSSALDQTQLTSQPGIVQKVEVYTGYLYNYVLNCADKVNVGSTAQLSGAATLVRTSSTSIKTSPTYALYGGITYKLSDSSLASIDSNNVLLGTKGGNLTISMMNGSTVLASKSVVIYEPFTGIKKASDGNYYLYDKDVFNANYNGLYYDKNMGWWLIKNGRVALEYSGIYCDVTYGYWLIQNGTIAKDYNDLYYDSSLGWWKITNGTIDFSYNGLYCSPTMGWWKIYAGTIDFLYNDLYYDEVYGWYKITGGTIDLNYNDLYCSPTMGWWKIANGTVDFFYNDLYCSPTMGWWKVAFGAVDFAYDDIFYSPTVGWWKVKGGTIDIYYNDLFYSGIFGWWKITNGTVDFYYNDLYCSPTVGWWKVANGAIQFDYTDLYCSPTVGWWKIVNGAIDFPYTGSYDSPTMGGPWNIVGGALIQ